jgi:hypothetical protein
MLNIAIRYSGYDQLVKNYKHQIVENAMKDLRQLNSKAMIFGRKMEGKILPPLILWMLGVPGGVVLLLWVFFFRD